MSTVSQSFVLTGRTEFFFPFPVRFEGHINLSIEGGSTVNPADYSVTGAGPASLGVTVVYPTAPADGELLTISRVVLAERRVAFEDDAEITAAKINAEFDNVYQKLQELLVSLPAPLNLTAEVLSATQLLLTWDEVPGATIHRVYKDGPFVDLANGSWVDNSFDPNVVTTYEVRGILIAFVTDPGDVSLPVTTVGAAATLVIGDDGTVVPPPPETLTVPQAFAATQTGIGEITLTWELLTPATHIDIEIDGAVTRIAADVRYVDTGLTTDVEVDYRIRAVNEEADPEVVSAYTSIISITPVALGIPDPNVTVQSSTRILVDWADVPGATAYDIEIDGEVTNLTDFSAVLDAGLDPVTTRTYRVRALSGGVTGEWSPEVTGTTFRTEPIVITGVLRRLSYFPSDNRITARALEAEFNNIHALMAGGTLTENTTEPVDGPGTLPNPVPPPAPPPDPDPVDPDPPDPPPVTPPPDPVPPTPSIFPPAPSGSDPARPAGWTLEANPNAALPSTPLSSWVDVFGGPFPFGSAFDMKIGQNKYVAFGFNSGDTRSYGQINFADLGGAIAGVGIRPALVTISPYPGDFRLSLGAPYYRLIGVGALNPAYAWTRTEGTAFRAYLPPNTDLYFNIAFVSTASQNLAASNLVWQCTATNPTQCGWRLQPISA